MAKGQQKKHEQISEICEERFNNILNVDRNEYIGNTTDNFTAEYHRYKVIPWKKEIIKFKTNREKLKNYDNGGCHQLKIDICFNDFLQKAFDKFGNKFNYFFV